MKTFENKIKVFFNPNIVNFSGDEISLEEGCLSFPDLFFKVKRPTTIRIRYTDKYDVTETIQMTGLDARIAQHEYDHLQGILYTSKVNFFTLNKAKKARKKIRKSH
jgi:peptide deformylase